MAFSDHLGEDISCRNCNLQFFIVGADVNPKQITHDLRLQPTTAYAKGDEFKSKSGVRKRVRGKWCLNSEKLLNSTSPERHAKAMLKLLVPKKEVITRYLVEPSIRVGISVWWEGVAEHGGFTFSSKTLNQLSELCNEIDFFFISSESENDRSKLLTIERIGSG